MWPTVSPQWGIWPSILTHLEVPDLIQPPILSTWPNSPTYYQQFCSQPPGVPDHHLSRILMYLTSSSHQLRGTWTCELSHFELLHLLLPSICGTWSSAPWGGLTSCSKHIVVETWPSSANKRGVTNLLLPPTLRYLTSCSHRPWGTWHPTPIHIEIHNLIHPSTLKYLIFMTHLPSGT